MDNTITEDERKELEALRAEKATWAQKRHTATITCKVSAKGALSLYGLGRFPVTLYKSQWERLIKAIPDVSAFLEANTGALAVKGE